MRHLPDLSPRAIHLAPLAHKAQLASITEHVSKSGKSGTLGSALWEYARTAAEWGSALQPTLQFAHYHLADHFHAFIGIIEARDMSEVLAAMLFEDLVGFASDFLQRFQAIS